MCARLFRRLTRGREREAVFVLPRSVWWCGGVVGGWGVVDCLPAVQGVQYPRRLAPPRPAAPSTPHTHRRAECDPSAGERPGCREGGAMRTPTCGVGGGGATIPCALCQGQGDSGGAALAGGGDVPFLADFVVFAAGRSFPISSLSPGLRYAAPRHLTSHSAAAPGGLRLSVTLKLTKAHAPITLVWWRSEGGCLSGVEVGAASIRTQAGPEPPRAGPNVQNMEIKHRERPNSTGSSACCPGGSLAGEWWVVRHLRSSPGDWSGRQLCLTEIISEMDWRDFHQLFPYLPRQFRGGGGPGKVLPTSVCPGRAGVGAALSVRGVIGRRVEAVRCLWTEEEEARCLLPVVLSGFLPSHLSRLVIESQGNGEGGAAGDLRCECNRGDFAVCCHCLVESVGPQHLPGTYLALNWGSADSEKDTTTTTTTATATIPSPPPPPQPSPAPPLRRVMVGGESAAEPVFEVKPGHGEVASSPCVPLKDTSLRLPPCITTKPD
ncbi:hypothetical protein O3P69_013877 [Scylla paramamosain]|uniref:Uncharacterized protein n=1 Tax=Scylla paramamosain TaxID=85552 RepID=A0AAW0SS62_SCYPA